MTPRGGQRVGSGRRKKYRGEATVARSFSITESLDREIKRRAAKQGRNASEVVVLALSRAFRLTVQKNVDGRAQPAAEAVDP